MISGINSKWLVVFAVVLLSFSTLFSMSANLDYPLNPIFESVTIDDTFTGVYWGDPVVSSVVIESVPGNMIIYSDDEVDLNISTGSIFRAYNLAPGANVLDIQNSTILGGSNTLDAAVYGDGAWVNQGGGSTFKTQYFGQEITFFDQFGTIPVPVFPFASVYADAVLGITEIFVQDAAGNLTQISTHHGDDWIFESTNRFTGRTVSVDMERALLALDALVGGAPLVTITVDEPELDWNDNEASNHAKAVAARELYFERFPDGNSPPEVFEIAAIPAWLAERNIELGR